MIQQIATLRNQAGKTIHIDDVDSVLLTRIGGKIVHIEIRDTQGYMMSISCKGTDRTPHIKQQAGNHEQN